MEAEQMPRLPAGLSLVMKNNKLTLTDGKLDLAGDFSSLIPRLKPNNLNGEFLVKAARIKNAPGPLTLLDATAGLGEDSFLLAAAGFGVSLYEYDPVISALLEDALKRAAEDPLLGPIASRMTLYKEDSVAAMKELLKAPDVILLDPMFPERQKSGLIKKKFQLLQQLESPCCNEEDLLGAAFQAGPKKILVKRPLKGPFLAGRKPDYSLTGSVVRYDCFILSEKFH